MRALVLEPDPTVRACVEAGLRSLGHDVVACSSAASASAAFERYEPLVAVVDWTGAAGPELCRRIRSGAEGQRCVVLATGLSDRPADVRAALEGGADDYLPKMADAGVLEGRLAVAELRVRQLAERFRAEEALGRLQKAVDTMQLGVTITDTRGRILYTNAAEAAMHGYAVAELIGADARILSPRELWKRMSFEELQRVKKWQRERVRRRKDGATFPVRLLSDVVTDAEGRATGIVTTCEDVTERRQAEEALRQSERRYRSVVETARDVVATVSRDGRITSLNPAFEALTGWGREPWIGRGLEPLVHPDDLPAAQALLQRALRGDTPQQAEVRFVTRTGEEKAVELMTAPQVVDGDVSSILVLVRDVTDRKRQQRREATLHVATRVLGEAATLADGARGLLQALCVGLGWEVGVLWTVSRNRRRLRCAAVWHLPTVDVEELWAETRNARLAPGEGRVGAAWENGTASWTADGAGHGLRAVVAVPIRCGEDVTGVLELSSPDARPEDAATLRATQEIADGIGNLLARRQAGEALRESEERYALAVRGANDGLWDWDLRTGEVYYSPRWKAIVGCGDAEVGRGPDEWLSRIHPDDVQRVRDKVAAHLEGRAPHFEDEHRVRHKEGSYRWVHCRGFAVRHAGGQPCRMAGALTDVTDRRAHDPLTGLPNRALFVERLGHSLARARRQKDGLFAVLFIDLDRFKVVNDSLGHLAGDRLLIAVARRLEGCVRPGDVVGRFGGDEFAVLLDPIGDVADATRVAERIQKELAAPLDVGGPEVFTSASIGISLSATGYERPEDVLRDADTAMYRAKAEGKARYEVFDEAMRERVVAQLRVENELRHALGRGELCVHYQPIVGLRDGGVAGFEALLRWRHPDLGLLLPDAFLTVAEETGLIVPAGEWVLREACRQLRAWQERYPLAPPLWVSVNVSGRQLAAPDLSSRVDEALRGARLDPASLRLEITEGVLMETRADAIGRLRALGVRLDVDDFGTGYSSLAALHRLPVDALKVDRSFVQAMGAADGDAAIVKTILALAHNLGLSVVAEGVESRRQATRLRALGCGLGQGHYFSKAVDAAAAERLLAARGGAERAQVGAGGTRAARVAPRPLVGRAG